MTTRQWIATAATAAFTVGILMMYFLMRSTPLP